MTVPTPGRIVLYSLTKALADATNKRRKDAQDHLAEHRENSNGVQIHVGNSVAEGDVYPMTIVRVWGDTEKSAVNGQVSLDGNDVLWITSACVGTGPGTFAWPVRA